MPEVGQRNSCYKLCGSFDLEMSKVSEDWIKLYFECCKLNPG